jgi:hypothetical protein
MDRVRILGDDLKRWTHVPVKEKGYDFEFSLPSRPDAKPAPKPLPLPNVSTDGIQMASHVSEADKKYRYLVAWGKPDEKLFKPDDAWFARVRDHLVQNDAGARITGPEVLEVPGGRPGAGRQWMLTLADGSVRFVRVYVVNSRVYYLSAECEGVQPNDDEYVTPFFASFLVNK